MDKEIKKEKKCFKILFQATNPNLFRAIFIGYLYEVSQKHQVVLLAGEIDSYTKKILGDKNLFPGLEKIIFFEPPFYGDIFRKNSRLCQKSKELVRDYKPDIVIVSEDIWPMGLYLLRFAKKIGAITIAIQDGFRIAEKKKLFLWSCLTNSYMKMPRFLPFAIRFFLVKMKKYFGHFLYYWILPLVAGEMPFPGKTSFVFWDTSPGLRDADYSAVFSKRDYDLSIKDGVKPEKIFMLGHPLEHKPIRRFFEKVYFSKNKSEKKGKILTIMWSDEKIGFRRQDYSLIPEEKMRKNRAKAVKLIATMLEDWKILIKPHPAEKNALEIKELLGQIQNNISVVNPSGPADKYIEMSRVVIGMPPPSTTLFTACKQNPEKVILSLNLDNEFLGDVYKNFNGIEYIDSEIKLSSTLDLIRNNKYYKKQSVDSNSDFSDTCELLNYIHAHHLKTPPQLLPRRASK